MSHSALNAEQFANHIPAPDVFPGGKVIPPNRGERVWHVDPSGSASPGGKVIPPNQGERVWHVAPSPGTMETAVE